MKNLFKEIEQMTLIEWLIAISIFGILLSVVLTSYNQAVLSARCKALGGRRTVIAMEHYTEGVRPIYECRDADGRWLDDSKDPSPARGKRQ